MSGFLIVGIAGIALQACVLHILFKGAYRRFPGITLYVVILILTSVADATAYRQVGWWPQWYEEYYYLNNTLRHFGGFVALVSLIYLASTVGTRKGSVFKLSIASVAVIAASLLLAQGDWPNQYMNEASRNLSFATVILNIVLWLSLVKNRARDSQLFMVSGGLGLNMAGEAVGQSLLRIAVVGPDILFYLGNIIAIGSHFLCLLIWWRSFRSVLQESAIPNGVPSR